MGCGSSMPFAEHKQHFVLSSRGHSSFSVFNTEPKGGKRTEIPVSIPERRVLAFKTFQDKFCVKEMIGTGSFGKVFKIQSTRGPDAGTISAAKFITVNILPRSFDEAADRGRH